MEPKVLHRSMVGDILPARAALPHWIFGSGFQIAHYTLVRITQSGSVPQQPPTEDHEGARDTPDTHCVAGTGSRGPTALPDLRKRCGCVTTTSPVHHHVPTHRGFARTSTCTVNASHPTDVGCAKRRTCWNSDSTGPAAWIIRRHQLSGGGGGQPQDGRNLPYLLHLLHITMERYDKQRRRGLLLANDLMTPAHCRCSLCLLRIDRD